MMWSIILVHSILVISIIDAFTSPQLHLKQCAQYKSSLPGYVIQTRREKIILNAFLEGIFQKKDKDNIDSTQFTSDGIGGEAAATAKMMEDHRRAQEAAEQTAALMEELSSTIVVGKSKAGVGGGLGKIGDNRKGGIKVSYDGQQRPLGVEIDPNFLFMSESEGVISIDDLNDAITDALKDGHEQSTKLMEEKIKGLYESLGLSREAQLLPIEEDEKNK